LRALNYAGLTAVATIFKEFLISHKYFITWENKAFNNMNGKKLKENIKPTKLVRFVWNKM